MSEHTQQGMIVTPEILKEMLLGLAQELRKPPEKTPEQKAQEEQAKKDRAATARAALQAQLNRIARQKTCTHMRSNGSTTAVYVQNMNLMICQHCQGLVYPENMDPKKGGNGVDDGIYDTALFNKLLMLYSDSVGNV